MKELLQFVAQQLVNNPNAVEVRETQGEWRNKNSASDSASAQGSEDHGRRTGTNDRPFVEDASFRLIVSGNVGVKEIQRLIAKLQLDKEILADQDSDDKTE